MRRKNKITKEMRAEQFINIYREHRDNYRVEFNELEKESMILFAEAYAEQKNKELRYQLNNAIEWRDTYKNLNDNKEWDDVISKVEEKRLKLKIEELIEAVEMARDEAIDKREGRKIDYPNALEGYLTEVLERHEQALKK